MAVRGNGLMRAHQALERLGDSQTLDDARRRFNESPPPYTSNSSHNSTLFEEPENHDEEAESLERLQFQFDDNYRASFPYSQLEVQIREEKERLWKADPYANTLKFMPLGLYDEPARKTVMEKWNEQGVWNKNWGVKPNPWRWKHEGPLELESNSGSESESIKESTASFTLFPSSKVIQKSNKRPRTEQEVQQKAERQAIREREREASRPIHQFLYQVSKERERMLATVESNSSSSTGILHDINTQAYENVRNTWIRRRIWRKRWRVLPGMSWAHEQPLKEMEKDEFDAVPFNGSSNTGNDVGEAAHGRDGLHSYQAFTTTISSPAPMMNGYIEHFSSASPISFTRPMIREQPQTSARTSNQLKEQTQLTASTSVGSCHTSAILKTRGNRKDDTCQGLRRTHKQTTSASTRLFTKAGPSKLEPQAEASVVTRRRSKRLQEKEKHVAEDLNESTSANANCVTTRPRLTRTAIGNSNSRNATKPRGIIKGQQFKVVRKNKRKKKR